MKSIATMTTMTTLALLVLNTAAVAMPIMPPPKKDSRVLTYNLLVEGSKVSPKHATHFVGGSAEINYAANTVTLKMEIAPDCKKGFACAQNIQMKIVELPVVEVASDNECYVTVKAQKDARMVDGILEQILIDDYSKSNCKFFVKPIADVKYLTSFVNRKTGKDVTTVSKLKADLVDVQEAQPAGEFFNLTGGEYLLGFPKNEAVSTGNITIFEDTVHLEIYNQSHCPVGAMCFAGPTVITGDFKIESRETANCAEVITASDITMGAGRRLVVTNYANSGCDFAPEHMVTAEYTTTIVTAQAHGPNQFARFYFDYAVVPFQK